MKRLPRILNFEVVLVLAILGTSLTIYHTAVTYYKSPRYKYQEMDYLQDNYRKETPQVVTAELSPQTSTPNHSVVDYVQDNGTPRIDTAELGPQAMHADSETEMEVERSVPMLNGGYVVAVSFMDEQTSALGRLLSLQCWAGSLGPGMSVVEPFLLKTSPAIPLMNVSLINQQPRFQDLFSLEHWHDTLVSPRGFAPLASWEDFLFNAPRHIVLIAFGYKDRSVSSFPYTGLCPSILEWFESHCTSFFERNNFTVISSACITGKEDFTSEQFRKRVLGKNQRNVTIIFSEWRGIGRTGTVIRISDSDCRHYGFRLESIESTLPSSNVAKEADSYIEQYLHSDEYVAIMVRFEWLLLEHRVDQGLKEVMQYLRKMQQSANLTLTFVMADIGTFGSPAVEKYVKSHPKLVDVFVKFLRSVTGNPTVTLKEWEETFVSVSRWTTAGYIAKMQMGVAVRAKCLILFGGGGFQKHSLVRYKKLHPDNQCYHLMDMA